MVLVGRWELNGTGGEMEPEGEGVMGDSSSERRYNERCGEQCKAINKKTKKKK
jgi:hypothetical protein